jgi:hypothetical protein
VRLRFIALLAPLLATAPLLGACGDGGLLSELVLSPDTAVVGLPGGNAAGSALDFVRATGDFDLLRNPELVADAEQWDIALRSTGTGLVFRPFQPIASNTRGAGITVSSSGFDEIDEAPRATSAYSTSDVPVTNNGVYLVRSRQFSSSGIVCVHYAKMRVLEVNAPASTVRVAVVINEGCDDERLRDD